MQAVARQFGSVAAAEDLDMGESELGSADRAASPHRVAAAVPKKSRRDLVAVPDRSTHGGPQLPCAGARIAARKLAQSQPSIREDFIETER